MAALNRWTWLMVQARQVAAVGAAHDSHGVLVERGEFLQGTVQEGEHVLHVHGAHPLLDGPAVRLAVACGSARVAHHHRVSGLGIHLRFVK